MHNFCTLFDSNYLPRALVMYRSLINTEEEFTLYVVCFDDLAYDILKKLQLTRIVPIQLSCFESKELLAIKHTRTTGEYCWTCTPHVIRYVLDTYNLQQVTYLDADLCFYAKPSILLNEFEQENASVLITEHRYTPVYDYSIASGIYCVQFMTFKADEYGYEALQWWQDRCIEWCFNRYEDGKFGDQKYLDDWPKRFKGVHVLQNLGGGVAPWNVQQYKVSQVGNQVYIGNTPLNFYHFQNYTFYKNGIHDFIEGCKINKNVVDYIYKPYGLAILDVYNQIYTVNPTFDRGWGNYNKSLLAKLVYLKRILRGVANEHRII